MPQVIITALFDSRATAEAAIDRLVALGIAADHLHVTAQGDDDADAGAGDNGAVADLDPRPLFDRIGDFFFPDEDRDILSRTVEEGAIMITATAVPEVMEAAVVRALDDAGALEIDETDSGPHESALRDVAASVTSGPKPDAAEADDPRLDDETAILSGIGVTGDVDSGDVGSGDVGSGDVGSGDVDSGDVDSGTAGMAGMDTPHAGVTADRAARRARRDASTRRVRSYWIDEAGELENAAVERGTLPG